MIRPYWILLLLSGLLTACPPEKPSDQDSRELGIDESAMALDPAEIVVARVNGEEITLEEFQRRIDGLVPYARVRVQSLDRQKEFLNNVAQFEILADVAELKGYGASFEVRHSMKETMAKLLLADVSREVSLREIEDQELVAYFESHGDSLRTPEERRLSEVFVEDRERALELRRRFQEEYAHEVEGTERGAIFIEFAFRYSEERRRGDLGGFVGLYSESDESPEAFRAFELQPFEVVGPDEVEGGFLLQMVTGQQEAVEPSFEEMESEIRNLVLEMRREDARRALLERLRHDAVIERNQEAIETVDPPAEEVPLRIEELPRTTPMERR